MKLFKNKKIVIVLGFIILAVGAWGLFKFGIKPAFAQSSSGQGLMDLNSEIGWTDWLKNPGDTLLWAIGRLIQALVWIGGQILAVLMWILFKIARYNHFIDSPAVENGWVIVRDLCNIFFVVIFLVMTVATVLGIADYSYNRILSNLLIMVVLINFSKLICGIFIDVSQVIMLTFMNSFGKLGSGYLTEILGITDLLAQAKANMAAGFNDNSPFFSHLGSFLLVLVYVIVALATILVIILVLVQRIIMLWIYVVLSPFAYALKTFPAGSSYANKWWSDFVKYLTIGPIVAFFIWLSFVSLGNVSVKQGGETNSARTFKDIDGSIPQSEIQGESAAFSGSAVANMDNFPQAGETQAGSPSHMVKFIIAIAMLWGGLITAQTIGGFAGSFAGSTMGILSDMGTAALDKVNRMQAKGLKPSLDFAGDVNKFHGLNRYNPLRLLNVASKGTGMDLNIPRWWDTKIKPGYEAGKVSDLEAVDQRATEILTKGKGVVSLVGGINSPDWYKTYAQNPLRGVVTAGMETLPWVGAKQAAKRAADWKEQLDLQEMVRSRMETSESLTLRKSGLTDEKRKVDGEIGKLSKEATTYKKEWDDTAALAAAAGKPSDKAKLEAKRDKAKASYEKTQEKIEELTSHSKAIDNEMKDIEKGEDSKITMKDVGKGLVSINGKEHNLFELRRMNKQLHQDLDKVKKAIEATKDEKKKKDLEKDKAKIEADIKNNEDIFKQVKEGIVMSTSGQVTQADNKTEDFRKEFKKFTDKQARYMKFSAETTRSFQSQVNKKEKDIVSENADELMLMYSKAVGNKDTVEALAILKKLAKNVDMNEIMGKYGYNVDIGLTESQASDLMKKSPALYESKKGYNDFWREEVMKKLGLNKQSAFAMQSMISGIHKGNNETFGMESVGIDEEGNYYQLDRKKQQFLASIHLGKQDKEAILRKGTRFVFGGENRRGEFVMNESGMDFMFKNPEIFLRETDPKSGRLSQINAWKISQAADEIKDAIENVAAEAQRDTLNAVVKGITRFSQAKGKATSSAEMEARIDQLGDISNKRRNHA